MNFASSPLPMKLVAQALYSEVCGSSSDARLQNMKSALCLFILLSCPGLAAVDPSDGWTPEISLQVQGIGEVVPSPDGRLVAYTQIHAAVEPERSEWVSQLFLARADGSQRIQLTQDETGATSPSFSPDGRLVYFVSSRSGKPNIWQIPVDGGEAERLTNWKGGLGGYKVSPNGKWIALEGTEPALEEEKARKEKRDWRVVDEPRGGNNLYLVSLEPNGSGERLVRRLMNSSYHVTNFDWSPDSRFIAFEHQPDPGEDSWTRSDLSEVEVAGGSVQVLADTGAAEGEPRYSPDGRFLAYLQTPNPARWAGDDHIVLLPRQGGPHRVVPDTFDKGTSILALKNLLFPSLIPRKAMGVILGWSSDSARLLFAGEKGTRYILYSVSIDGLTQPVYAPKKGVVRGAGLNSSGTYVGFSLESSEEPPEAFVMNLSAGLPSRVSAANLSLPKLPLGETQVIRWKSKDNLEIEGLLTLPPNYEPGKKVPLIVVIHGGPMGWFQESFIGSHGIYPLASFASRGYAILRPNIRGFGRLRQRFPFC